MTRKKAPILERSEVGAAEKLRGCQVWWGLDREPAASRSTLPYWSTSRQNAKEPDPEAFSTVELS